MSELTIQEVLRLGTEAHQAGNIRDADRYYTAILKAQPNHAEGNHSMGLLAVSLKKFEQAIPYFEKAIRFNPNASQFWLSLFEVLIKLEKFDEARDLLDRAQNQGLNGEILDKFRVKLSENKKPSTAQEPPQSEIKSLISLYEKKQFQDVLGKLNVILNDYPKSVFLNNLKGVCSAALKEFSSALESYKNTIELKPDYAEAYYNMGNAYQEMGDLTKAAESYKSALKLRPNEATIHTNLGNVFKSLGDYNSAFERYQKATQLKPDYAEAHNNLGNIMREKGDLDGALEKYQQAIKCNPQYAEAIENLLALLKIHNFAQDDMGEILTNNQLIAKSGETILNSNLSDPGDAILHFVTEGLRLLTFQQHKLQTNLSQIYRHGTKNFNCNRHMELFEKNSIISQYCFGCYKVQVTVDTVIELIKLTGLFYRLNLNSDTTTKTFIELRPNISGYYKGLIYCRGLDQAVFYRKLAHEELKNSDVVYRDPEVKRGCSEFPLVFPKYAILPDIDKEHMDYPIEWHDVEKKFDKMRRQSSVKDGTLSIPKFSLSDMSIIEKWIDYAKGLGDPSINCFSDRPIVYSDVYKAALKRKKSYQGVSNK